MFLRIFHLASLTSPMVECIFTRLIFVYLYRFNISNVLCVYICVLRVIIELNYHKIYFLSSCVFSMSQMFKHSRRTWLGMFKKD